GIGAHACCLAPGHPWPSARWPPAPLRGPPAGGATPTRSRSPAGILPFGLSDVLTCSCSADGEDGDVVGERLGGEVPGRLEQDLAQRGRLLPRVAAQDPGDALLTEQLLARSGLGQAVGVEQQQV